MNKALHRALNINAYSMSVARGYKCTPLFVLRMTGEMCNLPSGRDSIMTLCREDRQNGDNKLHYQMAFLLHLFVHIGFRGYGARARGVAKLYPGCLADY